MSFILIAKAKHVQHIMSSISTKQPTIFIHIIHVFIRFSIETVNRQPLHLFIFSAHIPITVSY